MKIMEITDLILLIGVILLWATVVNDIKIKN